MMDSTTEENIKEMETDVVDKSIQVDLEELSPSQLLAKVSFIFFLFLNQIHFSIFHISAFGREIKLDQN